MTDAQMRHALSEINEIVVRTVLAAETIKAEGEPSQDRLARVVAVLTDGLCDIGEAIDGEAGE